MKMARKWLWRASAGFDLGAFPQSLVGLLPGRAQSMVVLNVVENQGRTSEWESSAEQQLRSQDLEAAHGHHT